MINKIKLKNWKSHSDSSMKFSRGTNALLGPMGSGKSSVMNAICFGLFGTFPDLQSRKIKLDDIIMNKPSVKDESQVTVNFTIEDRSYSVMRVVERDKGTTYSEIREGDKLLDAPNSQRVTEIIEKLLKIDYELFSRAIYSEQNGLDYFLRLPRGERMRRIDNLLMIDRFEQARSGTVTLINRIIERKRTKESVVNLDNIKELEKSLQDIEYSLKNLGKTKINLSEELEDKRTRKEELEKEIKEIEEIDSKLNSLKEKRNSMKGSIKEIRNSIEKYSDLLEGKKLDRLKQELREILELTTKYQKELGQKREIYDILTKDISEKKAKVSFTEKEINELERRIKDKVDIKERIEKIKDDFGDEPQDILQKKKGEIELLKTRITELKTKLVQVKESLSKISSAEDVCPTCESEISGKKRKNLIESFEGKIESFSESLRENKEKIKIKEENLRTLEGNSRKFELYLERIKGLEKDKKELEEKIKENEAYLEIISRKNEEFNKTKEEISEIEVRLE
ncbi:MAG: AAA family ATPase, partial [Candidatus Aenigmarchaeota archaeon]|nr:AAA family ATPase [Candidatus Aenigmarchaeota archaeon]